MTGPLRRGGGRAWLGRDFVIAATQRGQVRGSRRGILIPLRFQGWHDKVANSVVLQTP